MTTSQHGTPTTAETGEGVTHSDGFVAYGTVVVAVRQAEAQLDLINSLETITQVFRALHTDTVGGTLRGRDKGVLHLDEVVTVEGALVDPTRLDGLVVAQTPTLEAIFLIHVGDADVQLAVKGGIGHGGRRHGHGGGDGQGNEFLVHGFLHCC